MIALLLSAAGAHPARAQVVGGGREAPIEPVDSADVRGRARAEQARFERLRRRRLPLTRNYATGSDCDEIVGRFCIWFDEDDEAPEPEPPSVDSLREDFLAYLDSVQTVVPGDEWVLGQRVWYSGEGGHWARALAAARSCGSVEPWWCAALEGLALHGLGSFVESERAFDRALSLMDPEQAEKWRDVRRPFRGGVRSAVKDAGDDAPEVLERIWTLADPSYLVPGNDRKTEHLSRLTAVMIREHARNPHQITWGSDLSEMLVRFGWEVAWARARTWKLNEELIVGYQRPAGREYIPGEDAVRDPAHAGPDDFEPHHFRPRSLYTPVYAPVVLPMDGQVVAFPRADSVVVVATTYLPEDTTRHLTDQEPRPWMDAGDQEGMPDRRGLFLVPVGGGGGLRSITRGDGTEGALVIAAPAGAWVVSAEAWSPAARIEGRTRQGLLRDTVPRDVATLSDLLLVREEGGEPASLADAVARALPRRRLESGASVGVVWEVNGLGWNPATVAYDLSLEPVGRNIFRRLGEGLGLVGHQHPLSLNWEEPGPERPSVALRHVALTLPDLDPGAYRLRLRVQVSGRTALTSETELTIDAPR